MNVIIEKNLEVCRGLWKKFSPDLYISDNWNYRLCFNKAYGNEPYFIVGVENGETVACIPLEYDHLYEEYIFFGGGDWNEHLRFFCKPGYESYISELLKEIPEKSDIINIDSSLSLPTSKLAELEPTYFLNPRDFDFNVDTYLASWSKKRRKNVRYDIRQIEELKPNVIQDRLSDVNELMHLNRDQYKHESAFTDDWFIKALKEIVLNEKVSTYLRTKSVEINGKVCAVAFYSEYKGDYTFLCVGVSPEIPNLFKYLNFKLIEKAFINRVERIDFLADECGWKEGWKLKTEMMYKLR